MEKIGRVPERADAADKDPVREHFPSAGRGEEGRIGLISQRGAIVQRGRMDI